MKKSIALATGVTAALLAAWVSEPALAKEDSMAGGLPVLTDRVGELETVVQDLDGNLADVEAIVERQGTRVSGYADLYEVHSRVLWDAGWANDGAGPRSQGMLFYMQEEYTPRTQLPLGDGTPGPVILGPLGRTTGTAYGIPAVQEGAARLARLYVTYGHQWGCGTSEDDPPAVVIVDIGGVEFELPLIDGFYGHPAAHWSQFVAEADYTTFDHSDIEVFLRNHRWVHSHCGSTIPAASDYHLNKPKGVVYRVEVHYYDDFSAEE